MPALPELEVYKAEFTRELVGRGVTAVEPLDFRVVRSTQEALDGNLVGRQLEAVHRYGKWLYFDTGAPENLIIHLGLTGKLHIIGSGDEAPKFASLAVTFADGRRLVLADQRHLGKVYVRDFASLKAEKQLGPDLLEFAKGDFVTAIGRKRRGARDVLMDQHTIAGIGGKYADEILWQARLHPNAKIDRLSPAKLGKIYDLTMAINLQAIDLGADVERFPSDWLIPHRRGDGQCPLGHGPLTEHSSAFHCPVCQPAPNPYRRG